MRNILQTSVAQHMSKKTLPLKLLAGNGNIQFAKDVSDHLGIPLESAEVKRFADGEINIKIMNNIRGSDLFIIQSLCPPRVNDYLMELFLMIDAAKRASAQRITVVAPYLAYSRQDRKGESRVPISAKVIASMIENAGAKCLLTLDLHCDQIQGFYNIPPNNLFGRRVLTDYLRERFPEWDMATVSVVSPDAGGVPRARAVADIMGIDVNLVTIVKRRLEANKVEQMQIFGEPREICIIVDDMIDTGRTLVTAAKLLKDAGAKKVIVLASHGLFSNFGLHKVYESELDFVVVTDTVPRSGTEAGHPKLRVVSVAPLFAQAIKNIHDGESLSVLF